MSRRLTLGLLADYPYLMPAPPCEPDMEQVERAEKAEAAIARVREFLADKDEGLTDDARAQGHFILVDTDSVRRALEGDSDG